MDLFDTEVFSFWCPGVHKPKCSPHRPRCIAYRRKLKGTLYSFLSCAHYDFWTKTDETSHRLLRRDCVWHRGNSGDEHVFWHIFLCFSPFSGTCFHTISYIFWPWDRQICAVGQSRSHSLSCPGRGVVSFRIPIRNGGNPPSDEIFEREVNRLICDKVQLCPSMFKGHEPGKKRECGVTKTVQSMLLKNILSKMFEDVSQQQNVRHKVVIVVLL